MSRPSGFGELENTMASIHGLGHLPIQEVTPVLILQVAASLSIATSVARGFYLAQDQAAAEVADLWRAAPGQEATESPISAFSSPPDVLSCVERLVVL